MNIAAVYFLGRDGKFISAIFGILPIPKMAFMAMRVHIAKHMPKLIGQKS
jgi:hypothetical protein